MQLLSVYEAFLYYCCLVLVAKYILNYKPNMLILFLSFIPFIPLVVLATSSNTSLYHISYIVFIFVQFLLIKSIFRAKLQPLIFLYIIIYCTNIIVIALSVALFPSSKITIDIIVNTLTLIVCIITCFSKLRYTLQQFWACVPKYISVFSILLLVVSAILSAMIWGRPFITHLNVWSIYTQVATFGVLLIIGIVTPILIANGISNNQLKILTANYEHQIEVQAKYYKELAAANYDSRRFRHDYKNMQIAIEKLLADGKNQEALQLIQECGNAIDNPDGLQGAFDTGNGIADALLTDKQQTAKLCNAVIHFQGAIAQDALLPTDLCVILGNTLDNAIEACQKLPPETEKTISITCSCNSGFLFLTVCNPVAEKVIVQNNRVATTKEDKTLHGFGLYSLQSVVKKYNGELHLHSTEDSFTVNIDLCVMSPQAQPSAK